LLLLGSLLLLTTLLLLTHGGQRCSHRMCLLI
jgi:hypothetical protein